MCLAVRAERDAPRRKPAVDVHGKECVPKADIKQHHIAVRVGHRQHVHGRRLRQLHDARLRLAPHLVARERVDVLASAHIPDLHAAIGAAQHNLVKVGRGVHRTRRDPTPKRQHLEQLVGGERPHERALPVRGECDDVIAKHEERAEQRVRVLSVVLGHLAPTHVPVHTGAGGHKQAIRRGRDRHARDRMLQHGPDKQQGHAVRVPHRPGVADARNEVHVGRLRVLTAEARLQHKGRAVRDAPQHPKGCIEWRALDQRARRRRGRLLGPRALFSLLDHHGRRSYRQKKSD